MMPSKKVYDKMRYNILEYYDYKSGENNTVEEHSDSEVQEIMELKKAANKRRGGIMPKLQHKVLHNQAENPKKLRADIGLTKSNANLYKLNFPCNKLSPSISKDLYSSFKINLKPQMKKTMKLSMIDTRMQGSEEFNKYAMKHARMKAEEVQGSKDHFLDPFTKERKAIPNFQPMDIFRDFKDFVVVNGKVYSKNMEFLRGYDDFLAMNSFMNGSPVMQVDPEFKKRTDQETEMYEVKKAIAHQLEAIDNKAAPTPSLPKPASKPSGQSSKSKIRINPRASF
jgi:hypothetical protein